MLAGMPEGATRGPPWGPAANATVKHRILQQLWVYSAVKTNEKRQKKKKSKGEFNLSPWLIPTPLNGDLVICESILLSFWG